MPSLLNTLKRLEYANYLIKHKATGSLKTFSSKMKLSKSGIGDILSQMRELGAKIRYDRQQKTYYYEENGEFCLSRFMKYGDKLSNDEAAKIGRPDELCFSETAVFVPCKEI